MKKVVTYLKGLLKCLNEVLGQITSEAEQTDKAGTSGYFETRACYPDFRLVAHSFKKSFMTARNTKTAIAATNAFHFIVKVVILTLLLLLF